MGVREAELPVGAGAPVLRIRLFGPLDIRLGDRLAPLPSARAASLLGYLVLHPDVLHPRQRLAFLLWPDSTEGQARTNLRNVVHLLRRALPDAEAYLQVTPGALCWRSGSTCAVDVAEFTAALDQAGRSAHGSHARRTALRSAVDTYTGDLLEACYDEWLVEERERFRDRYVSALRDLTEELTSSGRHTEAIRVGRQLIRCDPLNEDHHRLVIAVHDAAGDRAGAVRLYHQCAAVLEHELGVQPSVATRDAVARVMRAARPVVDDHTAALGRVAEKALVGRDAEFARLAACWRDAEEGRSGLVLVRGEAGVGKTRLVEELASWCAHRGAVVASARSYPAEGELGYGAVIAWLRTPEVSDHLRRASPCDLADLARLLPELRPETHLTARVPDDPEERLRLFDAVVRALTGTGRPTLLVADDAHWSDAASLQLIHYLVRAADGRVLVVATARGEELDGHHPLPALSDALEVLDRATDVRLDRLTRDQTAELARQLEGANLDQANVDRLYAETEGNPLFVVETIHAGWDGATVPTRLTPKLQAVIGARLRRLSEAAVQVVGVAATVGRAFTAELLGCAAEVDDLTLARALDELWRRDVIREHGGDAYDFSHGKIRDVAYEALSPATRRHSHLRVAQALVALHGHDPEAVSGQVAVNYERAGKPGEAVAWYQRAALQAMRRYADAEAVSFLEQARSSLASVAEADRLPRELEIVSVLPTPLASVEGFSSDRLADVQRRAVDLAARLGVDPAPSLLRSLVMSSLCRDEFDAARVAAERLRLSAARAGDEGLAMESCYLLGIAAFWAADLESARRHFEHVATRFRPDQWDEHLLRFGQDPSVVCLSRLANTLWFLGRPGDARATRDAALDLTRERNHPFSTHVVYVFSAMLAVDLEEHDRLVDLVEEASAFAEGRFRSRVIRIKLSALRGYAEVLRGDAHRGIEHIRGAIEECGPHNPAPAFRATLRRLLAGAYAMAGDPREGLAAADEALRAGGTRLWAPETHRLRAGFLARLGYPAADVEAALGAALEVARRQGALGPLARVERSRAGLETVV